MNHSLLNKFR